METFVKDTGNLADAAVYYAVRFVFDRVSNALRGINHISVYFVNGAPGMLVEFSIVPSGLLGIFIDTIYFLQEFNGHRHALGKFLRGVPLYGSTHICQLLPEFLHFSQHVLITLLHRSKLLHKVVVGIFQSSCAVV